MRSRWWRAPLVLLFAAGGRGHGGGGSGVRRSVPGVEVRVVGLQPHTSAQGDAGYRCSAECAAGEVARQLLSAGAAARARRPAPHTVLGLGGLYECPCVPLSARAQFEEAVVEDAVRHWRTSGASGAGLTYLSMGAGGLFPDLMVLTGLLARGVRVSTVVLIDTIFEELIATAEHRAAAARQHVPKVDEDATTGLVRLTVPWRESPSVQGPSREVCGAARCRQCQDAGSLVPLPPAHGLGVIDLVANFCGWLSIAAAMHAEEKALDSRQEPRVIVLGHLDRLGGGTAPPVANASGTPAAMPRLPRADIAVFADLHADNEVERAEKRVRDWLLAPAAVAYHMPSGPALAAGRLPTALSSSAAADEGVSGGGLDAARGAARILEARSWVVKDASRSSESVPVCPGLRPESMDPSEADKSGSKTGRSDAF